MFVLISVLNSLCIFFKCILPAFFWRELNIFPLCSLFSLSIKLMDILFIAPLHIKLDTFMGSQMCRTLRDIRISTADFLTCSHVSILIHRSLVSFSHLFHSYHASTLYMGTTWHATCIEQVRFEPPSPIPGYLGNPLFSSLWYIGSAYISSPILLWWIVSYVYFLGSALRVLPFVMFYIYIYI